MNENTHTSKKGEQDELLAFARAFSAFSFTDTEQKLGYQWALKTLVNFKRQAAAMNKNLIP